MSKALLIIISGPPCADKTTLGKRLAEAFNLPFINKDEIKELLFERLGWHDRPWSKLLSLASYDLMFYFAESQLRVGNSLIVESNFDAALHAQRFLDLKEKYGFVGFEIQCQTEGEVILKRFKRRADKGERHPGHVDQVTITELSEILRKGEQLSLGMGVGVFTIDTTDFGTIDYTSLYSNINLLLSELEK
ncbi:MAG TPA: AAA family ATPase [Anaerolineales bacterium]|jgi:predicted kinase|nr:AAA family ATPase [Anaerolineales bacterium]